VSPSPSDYIAETLRLFRAAFVRGCTCRDPLDVRIEGARLDCGRCGVEVIVNRGSHHPRSEARS
jgi:hypothetical protein